MQRVKTYEDGIRDAAKLLTNTAEDLEQGFERRRKEIEADIRNRQLGVATAKTALQADEGKAQTLRGLAGHVLALMPSGPQDGSADNAELAQPGPRP